jgi:uncharacterized protein YceH (UPF0502 family)
VLCVLMLRGPQTSGELKQRTPRLHDFASLDEIERVLDDLIARELVARLPRRPGQKEQRYGQLLGDESAEPAPERAPERVDRLAEIERQLQDLRDEVAALRAELARSSPPPD